jgi:hypothetical protein
MSAESVLDYTQTKTVIPHTADEPPPTRAPASEARYMTIPVSINAAISL